MGERVVRPESWARLLNMSQPNRSSKGRVVSIVMMRACILVVCGVVFWVVILSLKSPAMVVKV